MNDQPTFPLPGPRSRRQALTLVEMISTLSVVLALGIAAISMLGDVEAVGRKAKQARQGRASIQRLAMMFRDDVRRAEGVRLADEASLELTSGENRVRYDWKDNPHVITRQQFAADLNVTVDRFVLPSSCRPRCSVDRVVTLRLSGPEQRVIWDIEVPRS